MKKIKIEKNEIINYLIIIVLSFIIFVVPVIMFPKEVLYDTTAVKAIALASGGLMLLVLFFIKLKDLKFDNIDITLGIFYILVILSTIFSINKKVSIFGEKYRYEGIIIITTYILIYYFFKYYFKTYKKFLPICLIISTCICIYAIMQYYNLRPIYDLLNFYYRKNFSSGTFGNSNFMGSFISIILPILLAVYMLKGEKKYLITSLITFTAMLCCHARSSWVAFGVCCLIGLIYCLYKRKKELFKRMLILLICFSIIFVLVDVSKNHKLTKKAKTLAEDIEQTATSSELSEMIEKKTGSSRIEIWLATLEIIRSHSVIGCGVDSLKTALDTEQPEWHNSWKVRTRTYIDKAHNEYLQIAATEGIPALVIYLSFLIIILGQNIKNMFKNKASLIFTLTIISYLVQAFFNISIIGIAPIFWMILGISQNSKFRENIDKCLEN